MMKEAMPVVLFGYWIPRPVRGFEILKNNTDLCILMRIIRPHIVISFRRIFGCQPRALKPGMLIGSMIDDQFGDHFQPATVCFLKQTLEFFNVTIRWINAVVVGYVVAIIAQR